MILAGDIGGTKSRLALFDDAGARALCVETFPTAAHSSLAEIVGLFLTLAPGRIRSACFGIAGPVDGGAVSPVNLPWPVYAHELAEVFELPAVALVNDLEANARGLEALDESDFAALNHGRPNRAGNVALVSAGTGLGEAGLIWDGEEYHVLASEGGHADFAPRSELEIELYRFLAAEHGHVSYERVCSGAGLVDIYRFLGGGTADAAGIAAEAEADRASLGSRALDLFVSIYGARAGNVALAFLAAGGVYLGGGIAPKIVSRLAEGAFMRAFAGKGRFAAMLTRIPVRVVLNDHAALLGAARIAAARFSHVDPPTSTRCS